MPDTFTPVDMNRSAFTLPAEVAQQVWADAQEASVVMQFANRIDLPGAGLSVPLITQDPTASWVDETEAIPTSDSLVSSKTIRGYKIGVIELFSKELRRDAGSLYDAMAGRLPGTIAAAFDATVMAGTAPGSDFDVLSDCAPVTLDAANAYDSLVAVDAAVSAQGGVVNGWVLSPAGRGVLLRAKDGNQRPLLFNDVQRDGVVSHLLGSPARLAKQAPGLGLAGDFSGAFYGVVEDIRVEFSEHATVMKGETPVNLFQQDMFAVKVTAHLGFAVRNKAQIVRLAAA